MNKQEATAAIFEHMKEIRQILHEFDPELDYLAMCIVRHNHISFWTSVDDGDPIIEFWRELPPLDKPNEVNADETL